MRTASLALLLALTACKEEPPKNLAPVAQKPLLPAKPATANAKTFKIDPASSKVTWVMNAPIERIYGELPGGVSGELSVDPMALDKTTGVVQIDLGKLVLFQQKREDETKEFGEKIQSAKQNEHARQWLEISPDTPPEALAQNQMARLELGSVTSSGASELGKLGEAPYRATVKGELVLHGRSSPQSVPVEVRFVVEGDAIKELKVKTLEPMIVSLEAHDVRPREAFGKLAAKTLDALGNKVTKEAPIDVELVAR